MAEGSLLSRLVMQEDLNFLLTNRIPRRYATLFMAWFSRLESRRLTKLSTAIWSTFGGDLNLGEATTREFRSLHEVFVRELRAGARPIEGDPAIAVSPCDAVVGAHGNVRGVELIQAKGFPYTLLDLLGDEALVDRYRDGVFVTLRLRSSMYHRFHAPTEGRVTQVTYVEGDTWNVNPIALRRVEKLFCKNTRAILELDTVHGPIALVPIAAILVGGIVLRAVPQPLNLSHRGRSRMGCDLPFQKGEELGHFQSGSTIVVFATRSLSLRAGLAEGQTLRMGEPLLSATSSHPKPRGSK